MRYLFCACCAVIALGACGGGVHASLGAPRASKGPATSAEAEARAPRTAGRYVEDRGEARARADRARVIAYLAGAGAEPHRRELAAERERRDRERRLMSDAESAARREADALQDRARVRAYLIALGAKARPPRPAPLPEEPGEPPFEGAVWTPGGWRWEDSEWAWAPGGWRDEPTAGDGVELALGILGAVLDGADGDDGGPAPVLGGVRDHRRGAGDPIVRDHRDGARDTAAAIVRDHRERTRDAAPIVRDHRDGARDAAPIVRDHRERTRDAAPIVRDHRDGARDATPTVRDHRDSKKDDDDRRPVTRDHRR